MIVVIIDGDEYKVPGRIAAIIRWVVEQRHLFMLGNRTIRLKCVKGKIYPSIEDHYDAISE